MFKIENSYLIITMGYNTQFDLTVSPSDHVAILEFIRKLQNNDVTINNVLYAKNPDFCYPFENELEISYYGKWYESDEDMKLLSKVFPDVIFTLSGCGEDHPDIWVREFINGEVIEQRPKFIMNQRPAEINLADLCIKFITKNPVIINPKIPADLWEKLLLDITRNNFSKICVDI